MWEGVPYVVGDDGRIFEYGDLSALVRNIIEVLDDVIPIIGAVGAAYSTSISRGLGTVLGIPIVLYFLKRSNHL